MGRDLIQTFYWMLEGLFSVHDLIQDIQTVFGTLSSQPAKSTSIFSSFLL
jgi:hypothetical protein